jgi:iron complex transport system substrate-binding protein
MYYKRIVSLAPSITETLFELGLGKYVVGRTEYCDLPVHCLPVETVGGFSDPDINKILKMEPDLVIGTTLHKSIVESMKINSIPFETVTPCSLLKATMAIRQIGIITGEIKRSEEIAEQIERKMEKIKCYINTFKPKMICYLCNISCPSWYRCTIAESITFFNCTLAGRHDKNGSGYESIVEKIVQDQPEMILVPECSKCRKECINPLLSGNTSLSTYIKDYRIPVRSLNSRLAARSGPSALQALDAIGKVIFGDEWRFVFD